MDPLDALEREINDAKDRLGENMLHGVARDYPTYRELVGRAEALDIVLSYIRDIRARYVEE